MDLISLTLTPLQYSLVANMFSFTLASMLAVSVFFTLARNEVEKIEVIPVSIVGD